MTRARRFALVRRLSRDTGGATLVEFAFAAPIFLVVLMAAMEFGYLLFMQSVLEGALTKAARDLTLESASTESVRAALDEEIGDMIRLTRKGVDVAVRREAVSRYSQIRTRAEPLADSNGNGRCDAGETFEDVNHNGQFDAQAVRSEWGGADDVVVYTVTLRFGRLFPVADFIGMSDETSLTSTKMLRIQPFENRSRPTLRSCPAPS